MPENKQRKVIMIICEGTTDETALSVFTEIYRGSQVRFIVTRGDITTKKPGAANANALTAVNSVIRENMGRYGLKKGDILRVMHVMDTDGAFIPDDMVRQGADGELSYHKDHIAAGDAEGIRKRNAVKRQNVSILYPKEKIGGVAYKAYYLSRNLEHALHGLDGALSTEDKMRLAEEFEATYSEDADGFKMLLNSDELATPGEYAQTWRYIMDGAHSLERHSNLHLAIE